MSGKSDVTLSADDRVLWAREFASWLPERVFDAHVHVFREDCFPEDFEFPATSCYQAFGGQHTAEQCFEAASLLLPDRRFGMLSFGTPHVKADRDAAAAYSGEISDNSSCFGLTLVAPDDDVERLRHRILSQRLLGYKPYRNYVTRMDPEAVRIWDMLPEAQLELANELGLVIMLHIPKSDRLADSDNQRDMVELCRRYPDIQVIFAHIGRAYWYRNVVGNLDGIAACPNAWIDTAMVNHPEVLEYAFRHFPRERILFGSDAPIAWLKGKSVEINDQYAYVMAEPYKIGTTIYDADHVITFTFYYYEILRGIKAAASRAGLSENELERMFWGNAHELLRGVARRLYGD